MQSKLRNRNGIQLVPVTLLLIGALSLAGCGGEEPTPTATALPPTAVPATATTAPTAVPATAVPPTATAEEATVVPATAAPAAADASAESAAYPAPVADAAADVTETPASYPPPATATPLPPGAYPPPVEPTPETSRIPIVPFVLERPLKPGATTIRGTGPANVPIVIADAFLMGEVLGEGVIDADGNFEITVPPLVKDTWIGVALNDLTDTEFLYSDFYANGFRGPGAEQVPQVGFLYDSEFVRE